MLDNFFDSRKPILVILLGSSAALTAAFMFEYIGNLRPCSLCIYQRIPHALIIILSLIWLINAQYRKVNIVVGILSVIILLGGATIAGFHVGVEEHLWEGTQECGNNLEGTSVEAMRLKLLQEPIARCDEIVWSMLGISMAGYNVLLSIIMAALALGTTFKLHLKRENT